MPNPSHKYSMVWSFGLLLLPENMLLTVDCITPDIVQSLFGVISLSLQYSKILLATASCNFIQAPVDYLLPKVYNFNKNKVVNVCTSCECVDNFLCVYYNCVVNTSLINKACCFIGHRNIKVTDNLKNNLTLSVENLIKQFNVEYFLFGSHSQFNDMCNTVVSNLKEKYPYLTRLGYTCKNEGCILERDKAKFEKLNEQFIKRDDLIVCVDEEVHFSKRLVAGKAAYIERNQAMIDNSKYCIFYFDYDNYANISTAKTSGTAIAYKYAKSKNKIIINLFN